MIRERRLGALRTAAPTAVVLFLAGVLTIYLLPHVWFVEDFTWFIGTWMQLAMSQRAFLLVLIPLGLALGARQAGRMRQAGEADPSTVGRTASVLATGAAVVVGYLAAAVVGGARILGTARYLTPEVFAVAAVGALALVGAVWLGIGVGRRWPTRATPPLLGSAAFILLLALSSGSWWYSWVALMLSPVQQMRGPDDYATVPGRVSAAQALWLTGLAVTALMLAVTVRRRIRFAAALPVVAGAILASIVMPRQESAVISATDPVARELVCAVPDDRICVSRVHAGLLDELVPPAREALALLAKLPNAPLRVHDDDIDARSMSQTTDPDVILTYLRAGSDGRLGWHIVGSLSKDDIVDQLLVEAFAPLPECVKGGDPVQAMAAAGWLSGRDPAGSGNETRSGVADAVQLWRTLSGLPEEQALTRVTALRTAALTCQEPVGVLAGSAT